METFFFYIYFFFPSSGPRQGFQNNVSEVGVVWA